MKGVWNNSEVASLFKVIEEKKGEGLSLRQAFEEHAKKYNRKPNAVRNYYYQEIDKLKQDCIRAKKLKIDLKKHTKNRSENFSKEDEKALIEKIEQLLKQGKSVRNACYILSNGDLTKMLRFQNKYRNYKKSCQLNSINQENIIQFSSTKKQSLTENDISSLFLGLVRLVKRNITNEIEQKQIKEKETLNQKLRKTVAMLGEKENEILSLKEKFEKIKKENEILSHKIMKLKCDKASLLSKN